MYRPLPDAAYEAPSRPLSCGNPSLPAPLFRMIPSSRILGLFHNGEIRKIILGLFFCARSGLGPDLACIPPFRRVVVNFFAHLVNCWTFSSCKFLSVAPPPPNPLLFSRRSIPDPKPVPGSFPHSSRIQSPLVFLPYLRFRPVLNAADIFFLQTRGSTSPAPSLLRPCTFRPLVFWTNHFGAFFPAPLGGPTTDFFFLEYVSGSLHVFFKPNSPFWQYSKTGP